MPFKHIFTIWSIICSSTAFTQSTVIPDVNFEQALIDLGLDSGAPNGEVLTSNISAQNELIVSNKNISSLEGIQDFSSLSSLECLNNNLESLDLSNNLNINIVDCKYNELTELILPSNILVERVDVGWNNLSSININQCVINKLWLNDNNLTSLDFTDQEIPGTLYLENNDLCYLNLPIDDLLVLYAFGNNNLQCIILNDVEWANQQIIDGNYQFDLGVVLKEENVDCGCNQLSVDNFNSTKEDVIVFPNPTNDIITIELKTGSKGESYSIYDEIGRMVISSRITHTNQKIDLSNLDTGFYILHILNSSIRIIKE